MNTLIFHWSKWKESQKWKRSETKHSKTKSSKYKSIWIYGFLLFILHFCFRCNFFSGFDIRLHGDGRDYLAFANKIITQGIFCDDLRLPGYPLFIAFLNRFQEINIQQDFATFIHGNGALSSLSAALFFVIASFFFKNRIGIFLATFFLFFHEGWLTYDATLLSENLTTFLIFVQCLLLYNFFYGFRFYKVNLVGIFVNTFYLLMVKPTYVFFPILLVGMLWAFSIFAKKPMRFLVGSSLFFLFTTFSILHYMSLENEKKNSFYGLTKVSNVNIFMKAVVFDLDVDSLKPEFVTQLDEKNLQISQALSTLRSENVRMHSFSAIERNLKVHHFDSFLEYGYKDLARWGSFLLKKFYEKFLTGSYQEMLSIIDSYDTHMVPMNQITKRWYHPFLGDLHRNLREISIHLSYFLIFNLLFTFLAWILVAIRKKHLTNPLLWFTTFIQIFIFYTLFLSAFASFGMGYRAKVTLEALVVLNALIHTKVLLDAAFLLVAQYLRRMKFFSHLFANKAHS